MGKKRKGIRYTIIVMAAAVTAAVLFALLRTDKGEPVVINRPTRETIIERIPANGKIRPVTEVKISPDVSGEIIELNVDEGDRVRKGDLIIKIRQDVYISLRDRAEASLNSTKAQYRQQKAAFDQAEQNYNRNRDLYEKRAISLQEFEASTAEYGMAAEQLKAAEYNIESATASLSEAEENLTKTVIYSPIDGIISSLSVEKGERVVGTSQMAGTEMLRIADFNMMEVLVDVNENDIISALTDVTNFEVRIRLLPASYADLLEKDPIPFRPGMSASVEIETDRQDNALTVPLQAVTSEECIFTYDPSTATVSSVKVSTGIQSIENIQITGGLEDADSTWIVTGPYSTVNRVLEDGMKVSADIEKHNDNER